MVAHLVSLKLALLRNSLKRSTMQLVGLIFGALYGLGILFILSAGLIFLGKSEPNVIATTLILAGSALILGWLIIPVVAAGLDMTLDPARFVTFAIPMKSMLAGLTVSSFIGIPGIITLLLCIIAAASWWQHPGIAAVAVFTGILAALTCIVASRAITSASASLASNRRFKDFSGIIMLVPLVLLGPIFSGIGAGIRDFQSYLPQLAQTLSWTPLGAIWAVPADLAEGKVGPALIKLLIAVATIVVLMWLWKVTLAKALVTPAHAGSGASRAGGKLGWFARFPATPAGSIAARTMTYWLRDPRYSAGLIIAPILPLVIAFALSQSLGTDSTGLIVSVFGALSVYLVTWSISSDISYDNTAFALHLSSSVSGKNDRLGRALPATILGLGLSLIFAIVGTVLSQEWWLLPGILGLILGVCGAGIGLASIFSALFIMNVPLPGDSPMKSRPGGGFSQGLIQMGGMLGVIVLAIPEIVLIILAIVTGNSLFSWLAAGAGLVLGPLLWVLGIKIGGKQYDKRAPELLLAVSVDR